MKGVSTKFEIPKSRFDPEEMASMVKEVVQTNGHSSKGDQQTHRARLPDSHDVPSRKIACPPPAKRAGRKPVNAADGLRIQLVLQPNVVLQLRLDAAKTGTTLSVAADRILTEWFISR